MLEADSDISILKAASKLRSAAKAATFHLISETFL